jgi:hypothetical protein
MLRGRRIEFGHLSIDFTEHHQIDSGPMHEQRNATVRYAGRRKSGLRRDAHEKPMSRVHIS